MVELHLLSASIFIQYHAFMGTHTGLCSDEKSKAGLCLGELDYLGTCWAT